MTNVLRYQVQWTGFTGSPGYSTFHVREDTGDPGQLQGWCDNLRTFCSSIATYLPDDVTLAVSGIVDVVEVESGLLVGQETVSPGVGVVGGDATGYSAATGAVIDWSTGAFRAGRAVRGRTFLVPVGGNSFSSSGTISTGTAAALQAAAVDMVDAEPQPLSIYCRPRPAAPVGALYAVSGVHVPTLGAVLRSRRD